MKKVGLFLDDKNESLKTVRHFRSFYETFDKKKLKPIYEYKPTLSDDPVVVVKYVCKFNIYATSTIPSSTEWYFFTQKNSLNNNKLSPNFPKNPLQLDKEGNRLYKSHYCHILKDFVASTIGQELVHCLQLIITDTSRAERLYTKSLSHERTIVYKDHFNTNKSDYNTSIGKNKPTSDIIIADNAPASYYDECDFNEKGTHCMPKGNIGNF